MPYIRPALVAVLPATVIPEKPKTFWNLIADILPGSMVGEHKSEIPGSGKGKGKTHKVHKAGTKATKPGKQAEPADLTRVLASLKKQIEVEGKKGYDAVRQEVLAFNTKAVTHEDWFPKLKDNAVVEFQREVDYVNKGLDKLYTGSPKLTREQVAQSSAQAEARVLKKVNEMKARAEKVRTKWTGQTANVVQDTTKAVNKALGEDWATLADKVGRHLSSEPVANADVS